MNLFRHPASPNMSILRNHSTMIRTKKLTLVQWNFIQDFTSCSSNVLFLFQDPNLHVTVMSPYSPPICETFLAIFVFYDLDTFEEYWSLIL